MGRLAHWPRPYRRFVIGPSVATPGTLRIRATTIHTNGHMIQDPMTSANVSPLIACLTLDQLHSKLDYCNSL